MIGLDSIRYAFNVQHGLIQVDAVGIDVVPFGQVRMCGGAEIEAWIDPSVDLNSTRLPYWPALSAVYGLHERITRHSGSADHR